MLKRILSTTFALLIFCGLSLVPTAQAQNEPGAVYLGVMGGLNQATLSGGDVSDSGYRSSFTVGGSVMYNVNEALSVEMEVLYSRRGAIEVVATGGPNISDALDYDQARIEMAYIDLPLLVKLTAPIEAVKIRGFTGFSISSLTDVTVNGQETQAELESNAPIEERFLSHDLNGILGGEIAVPIPGFPAEVALDGRYLIGFSDVDSEGLSMHNRTFTGMLSVRFML